MIKLDRVAETAALRGGLNSTYVRPQDFSGIGENTEKTIKALQGLGNSISDGITANLKIAQAQRKKRKELALNEAFAYAQDSLIADYDNLSTEEYDKRLMSAFHNNAKNSEYWDGTEEDINLRDMFWHTHGFTPILNHREQLRKNQYNKDLTTIGSSITAAIFNSGGDIDVFNDQLEGLRGTANLFGINDAEFINQVFKAQQGISNMDEAVGSPQYYVGLDWIENQGHHLNPNYTGTWASLTNKRDAVVGQERIVIQEAIKNAASNLETKPEEFFQEFFNQYPKLRNDAWVYDEYIKTAQEAQKNFTKTSLITQIANEVQSGDIAIPSEGVNITQDGFEINIKEKEIQDALISTVTQTAIATEEARIGVKLDPKEALSNPNVQEKIFRNLAVHDIEPKAITGQIKAAAEIILNGDLEDEANLERVKQAMSSYTKLSEISSEKLNKWIGKDISEVFYSLKVLEDMNYTPEEALKTIQGAKDRKPIKETDKEFISALTDTAKQLNKDLKRLGAGRGGNSRIMHISEEIQKEFKRFVELTNLSYDEASNVFTNTLKSQDRLLSVPKGINNGEDIIIPSNVKVSGSQLSEALKFATDRLNSEEEFKGFFQEGLGFTPNFNMKDLYFKPKDDNPTEFEIASLSGINVGAKFNINGFKNKFTLQDIQKINEEYRQAELKVGDTKAHKKRKGSILRGTQGDFSPESFQEYQEASKLLKETKKELKEFSLFRLLENFDGYVVPNKHDPNIIIPRKDLEETRGKALGFKLNQ